MAMYASLSFTSNAISLEDPANVLALPRGRCRSWIINCLESLPVRRYTRGFYAVHLNRSESMLTELFDIQLAQTLQFMERRNIVITEPVTWNLDGKAHPGPPITVFDASIGNETILILDRDTARVKIRWHPANADSPEIDWSERSNMTNMTVFRALMHAIVVTASRV